ncbi:MAG TPA: hypothetical protein ENJ79_07230 [Gammaproteobacteria bacterium]|nr:hypothetical protein [Gammaproteobacteria bacterium]
MYTPHPAVKNGRVLRAFLALALGAALGLPVQAGADGGTRKFPAPGVNTGMRITSIPPATVKCAKGFKAINVQYQGKYGHSYLCVSERPVCSPGHQTLNSEQFNKSKRRFEYVCAPPVP